MHTGTFLAPAVVKGLESNLGKAMSGSKMRNWSKVFKCRPIEHQRKEDRAVIISVTGPEGTYPCLIELYLYVITSQLAVFSCRSQSVAITDELSQWSVVPVCVLSITDQLSQRSVVPV